MDRDEPSKVEGESGDVLGQDGAGPSGESPLLIGGGPGPRGRADSFRDRLVDWLRVDVDCFKIGFLGGAVIGGLFAAGLNFPHVTANILGGDSFRTQAFLADLLDMSGFACLCGFLGGFLWNWLARSPRP